MYTDNHATQYMMDATCKYKGLQKFRKRINLFCLEESQRLHGESDIRNGQRTVQGFLKECLIIWEYGFCIVRIQTKLEREFGAKKWMKIVK